LLREKGERGSWLVAPKGGGRSGSAESKKAMWNFEGSEGSPVHWKR